MEDLDFSAKPKPSPEAAARAAAQVAAQSPVYQPALALEFFRSAGTLEEKPAGKAVFSENEKAGGLFSKGARMYLLLEGEIGLMIRNKFFGVVKPGDVFGQRLPLHVDGFEVLGPADYRHRQDDSDQPKPREGPPWALKMLAHGFILLVKNGRSASPQDSPKQSRAKGKTGRYNHFHRLGGDEGGRVVACGSPLNKTGD